MSATESFDESTQPHPRHRRDGVPLDGAPDLGLFASSRLDSNSADATAHSLSDRLQSSSGAPLAEPESPDLDLTEFGENPDVELAG